MFESRVSITHIFAPSRLAFDDPLRVRIEVVAGFQMRAQQQNEARVRVVGRRPIDAARKRSRARAPAEQTLVWLLWPSMPHDMQDALIV